MKKMKNEIEKMKNMKNEIEMKNEMKKNKKKKMMKNKKEMKKKMKMKKYNFKDKDNKELIKNVNKITTYEKNKIGIKNNRKQNIDKKHRKNRDNYNYTHEIKTYYENGSWQEGMKKNSTKSKWQIEEEEKLKEKGIFLLERKSEEEIKKINKIKIKENGIIILLDLENKKADAYYGEKEKNLKNEMVIKVKAGNKKMKIYCHKENYFENGLEKTEISACGEKITIEKLEKIAMMKKTEIYVLDYAEINTERRKM